MAIRVKGLTKEPVLPGPALIKYGLETAFSKILFVTRNKRLMEAGKPGYELTEGGNVLGRFDTRTLAEAARQKIKEARKLIKGK